MHLMSDPQDVPLTTTRLLLEPLVVAHAQSLYPLLQDERLYKLHPLPPSGATDLGGHACRPLPPPRGTPCSGRTAHLVELGCTPARRAAL